MARPKSKVESSSVLAVLLPLEVRPGIEKDPLGGEPAKPASKKSSKRRLPRMDVKYTTDEFEAKETPRITRSEVIASLEAAGHVVPDGRLGCSYSPTRQETWPHPWLGVKDGPIREGQEYLKGTTPLDFEPKE